MWLLKEEIQDSQQGHKMQHNDGKDSLLGSLLVLPVELWKGIAGWSNNPIGIYRGTYSYPNWLFGCSAWGTEPNSTQQVWYVGIL